MTAFATSLVEPQDTPSSKAADLRDIKKNFLEYEGKIVTLVGFLKGSHVGTFIESQDHTAIIRIRFAEDVKGKRSRPVRNALYKQFEPVANSMFVPALQPEPRASVKVRGIVSVLRRQGRLAESYNPYFEAPVEFVPIQVLNFEPVPRLDLDHD